MRPLQKIMRESIIQRKVTDYARGRGWMVCRLKDRSMPDRVFFGFNKVFMVEFKRPGGKLSADQAFTIKELREKGATVFVVDQVEMGMQIIDIQTTSEGKL